MGATAELLVISCVVVIAHAVLDGTLVVDTNTSKGKATIAARDFAVADVVMTAHLGLR